MLTALGFALILLAQGTTTTSLPPVCGNGVVEAPETCDPPYSRDATQCRVPAGESEAPWCRMDCRCPPAGPEGR